MSEALFRTSENTSENTLLQIEASNQDSDEDGDEDEDVLKLAQAESLPVTHAADVSLRLPARSTLICLVALKSK